MNERVKQLLVLGREHYAKREFEKAEQMLRMVLEEEDRYADVHDMLGVIAHSRGNFVTDNLENTIYRLCLKKQGAHELLP